MKKRRNCDLLKSNQQFWPCGYQLLSRRWDANTGKNKTMDGNWIGWNAAHKDTIHWDIRNNGGDLTVPRKWLTYYFGENKLEKHEWKIRQWHGNDQREILYMNMTSNWKSRVVRDFIPWRVSNLVSWKEFFCRNKIEICKWKLCWWVRNDQNKIPYKNIQLSIWDPMWNASAKSYERGRVSWKDALSKDLRVIVCPREEREFRDWRQETNGRPHLENRGK